MNQRFEEFYSQVGLDFENFQRVTVKKEDMEKFAELIVQECMNVLHDNELWNRHISHALKEHFGVEEWT